MKVSRYVSSNRPHPLQSTDTYAVNSINGGVARNLRYQLWWICGGSYLGPGSSMKYLRGISSLLEGLSVSISTRSAVGNLDGAFGLGRWGFIPGLRIVFRAKTKGEPRSTSMYIQRLSMWHDGCGVMTPVQSLLLHRWTSNERSGYFLTIPYPGAIQPLMLLWPKFIWIIISLSFLNVTTL